VAESVFSLKEAMDFYKSEVDLIQKYLSWLQVFCVGAITVVFTANEGNVGPKNLPTVKYVLLFGFIINATVNLIVIYLAQKNVYDSANCITAYMKGKDIRVPEEFEPLIGKYQAVKPYQMCLLPAFFDVSVIVVILLFMK
jgi:hypothetical protein